MKKLKIQIKIITVMISTNIQNKIIGLRRKRVELLTFEPSIYDERLVKCISATFPLIKHTEEIFPSQRTIFLHLSSAMDFQH